MVAIEESVAVILVVNGQMGLTNMGQEVADFLRKEVTRDISLSTNVKAIRQGQLQPPSFGI